MVPWALTGLLVMNYIGALAVGSVTHPSLSPLERCENAVTAFVLLEIGKMIAHEDAVKENAKKASRWIPWQTHDNLCEQLGMKSQSGSFQHLSRNKTKLCDKFLMLDINDMSDINLFGGPGFAVL